MSEGREQVRVRREEGEGVLLVPFRCSRNDDEHIGAVIASLPDPRLRRVARAQLGDELVSIAKRLEVKRILVLQAHAVDCMRDLCRPVAGSGKREAGCR